MSASIKFQTKMQLRFLDRGFAASLDRRFRRFYAISGQAVRVTAKRLLRGPLQAPLAELSDEQRKQYELQLKWHKRDKRRPKPRRPDRVSKPGKPPYLHGRPSVLKNLLWFALAKDYRSVVVGPQLINVGAKRVASGLRSVEELERSRPFMVPALEKVTPRIPEYLAKSMKG
jgi:hypothetical protein